MKDFFKRNSRMIKKIGITFVVPIILSITGCLIFLSAGWNLVAQSYTLGSTIFAKNQVNLEQVSFNINNQQIYRPDLGQVFAKVSIPSVGITKNIVHGDGEDELKKGVGHYAGSTLPGEDGNFVIAGHRDTVFKKLEDIKIGDKIFIETDWGKYAYNVSDIKITKPTDSSVLEPTNYEKLTMYTCYPFNYIGRAPERFVVNGEFVAVHNGGN